MRPPQPQLPLQAPPPLSARRRRRRRPPYLPAQLLGADFLGALPKLELPSPPEFLRPPRDWRSATFEVSFLDGEMRVTRGDRGELRVYLKDSELEPTAPADYED